MRICIECRHYEVPVAHPLAECQHPLSTVKATRDPVTGATIEAWQRTCATMRLKLYECGPAGALYEPKDGSAPSEGFV